MTTGLDVALALLDPVALASALALWLPAALLVGRAQDDPAGPAPRVAPSAVTRLTALLAVAVGLATAQAAAAGLVLALGAGDRVDDLSWPALAAVVTAAIGAVRHATPVLARQRRGRPVTDVGRWARSLAAIRAGAPAGVLATLLAVAAPAAPTAAPAAAPPSAAGPTVLPVVLAVGWVLFARQFALVAALVRAPRRPALEGAAGRAVPVPRAARDVAASTGVAAPRSAGGVPLGVPPSPACAWTTSPTPPRPTG